MERMYSCLKQLLQIVIIALFIKALTVILLAI